MGNLVCQLQVFPTQFSIFAPLLWNLLCGELPGDGKAPQVFCSSLATSNIQNLSHSTGLCATDVVECFINKVQIPEVGKNRR